ncbi:MAG: hypothetical protein FWE50_04695, partial [Alphaproteobacteria bacterium]|nr:hypothetical protein [Alphaproteobacteria bacterium]
KFRTAKAATNRECPYCCTSVSVKAVKCPNCLSKLTPVKVPKEQQDGLEKLVDNINPIKKLKVIKKKIRKIVK